MSDSDFDALVSSVASVIQEEHLPEEIQRNLRGNFFIDFPILC